MAGLARRLGDGALAGAGAVTIVDSPPRGGVAGASGAGTSGRPGGQPRVTTLAGRMRHARARGRPFAERITGLEPWLAVPCALALLLSPHPLVLPAAALGALPSAARWLILGRPWRRSGFDLPLGLLVGGALLGAWAGLSREGTELRLTGLLAGLVLYAAIVEHARTPDRLRGVVWVLLALATFGSVAMVFVVAPLLHLDRVPPLATVVATIDPFGTLGRISADDALLQRYRLRPSGAGALAAIGLALTFAVATATRGRPERLGLATLGVTFGAVLVVSDNRGAMLAAALTLGALAAFWRPRLLPLFPLAGLLALGAIAAGLVERGLNFRTIGQRLWFWENSLYLARELPLTGAGLGTQSVQATYQAYFLPASPSFSHAHNICLQGLLETGLAGLAGLLGLVLVTLWAGWRSPAVRLRSSATTARWDRTAALAGIGVALALFSSGLSEIVALSTVASALLLAALGVLVAADARARHGSAARKRVPARVETGPAAEDVALAGQAASVRPRHGWDVLRTHPRSSALVVTTVVAAALLLATGLGRNLGALVLLNAGTVELNRATLSEDADRADRSRGLERAVALLRTAATLDDADPTIQRNLALALAAQEDRRARAAADRARALTPSDDRRGLLQVGRVYAATSAWGEAIRAWQAAGATPQLLQLGNRLVRARNWDQALAAYNAVIAVQPNSPGAYQGIARVGQQRGGSVDAGIAELQALIPRGGEYAYFARVQMARSYREEGQPERALALIEQHPVGREEYTLQWALALSELGRCAKAEPLLRDLSPIFWEEVELFSALARCRLELGDNTGALAAARTGLALADPQRGSERAPFLLQIAESLLGLDRPAEALRTFEEASRAAPRDPRPREGAERARAALGR